MGTKMEAHMTLWWSVRSLGSLGALLAFLLQAEAGHAQTAAAPNPALVGAPPPLSKDAIVRVFSEEEAHSRPLAPNEYGIGSSSTVIGYLDLHPTDSAVSYSSDTFNGSRWNNSGVFLYADLHGIPHGAAITQIDFYFIDNDAALNFEGFLGYYYATSNGSGTPFGGSSLVAFSSTGTPGDGVLSETLHVTYSEALDANADGLPDAVHWWVAVGVPTASTRVKMIRILWRRQVSPAPQLATFADVPTNHPFFQFIEALRAAGITSGCNTNPPLFCPNSPITRGQAAVFLSIALGLHWP
jgi:S-layer homology domain